MKNEKYLPVFMLMRKNPQIWTSRCRIVEAFSTMQLITLTVTREVSLRVHSQSFKYSQVRDRNVVWI